MGSSDGDAASIGSSQESVGVVMQGTMQPEVVVVTGRDNGGAWKSSPAAQDTTYRVYKRRWLVLITVVLLNISNAGVSIDHEKQHYSSSHVCCKQEYSIGSFVFLVLPKCSLP